MPEKWCQCMPVSRAHFRVKSVKNVKSTGKYKSLYQNKKTVGICASFTPPKRWLPDGWDTGWVSSAIYIQALHFCFLKFALPRPMSWERLPQVSLPSIWTHSSSFFQGTSLRLHTTPSCASSPYLGSCEHQRENWTQSELHLTPITYFMTHTQPRE